MIGRILDPKALLVAAGAGALAYWLVRRSGRHISDLTTGALIGLGVQVAVRGTGVS